MADIQEGQTATNPKTGQKVVFKGGQWVNAGGGGVSGSGMGVRGPEAKELVEARSQNQDGRDVFHNLSNIYKVAKRYPGGIPNNVADSWGASLGMKGNEVQDQQLFNTLATRASIGKAKLLAPVSNADMENLKKSGPNPGLRFDNNRELIGQDYEQAARRYFENAFKQRFASKHGSLEATDAQGRSYPQALSEAMRRPDVAQELLAPWKRKSQAAALPADTSGFRVIR